MTLALGKISAFFLRVNAIKSPFRTCSFFSEKFFHQDLPSRELNFILEKIAKRSISEIFALNQTKSD